MGVSKPDDDKKVRLDKFLSNSTDYSRSEIKKIIKQKRVYVDGELTTSSEFKVCGKSEVLLDNKLISQTKPKYIAINKPTGYICSTQDESHPSVLNLLPAELARDLHFAGRLDVDTTGLVLVSNDGNWTHRVTSPKHKQNKTYRVDLVEPINSSAIELLAKGLMLRGEEKPTLPAKVVAVSEFQILLTISEGRYHQVKRMLAAVGNHVSKLHRVSIGEIEVDEIAEGEWKELEPSMVSSFL